MILFKTGFILMNFMTLSLLFAFMLGFTSSLPISFGFFFILIYFAFIYESKVEWKSLTSKNWGGLAAFTKVDFLNFWAVIGGGLTTFFLSLEFGLSAVLASALIGLAAHFIVPKYEVPAFCGSFVGMAAPGLTGYGFLLLAAVISGVIYVIDKFAYSGLGGKLGTTAFTGSVVAVFLTGQPFVSSAVPQGNLAVLLVAYSVVGAVVTYILNVRLDYSAVFSSGLVGLSAALVLPLIYPAYGATLAVMVFCASFAGMSSRQRISNEFLMAGAGVLAAVIFIFTSPYLNGVGGKLGTTAFASVMTVNGLVLFYQKIRRPIREFIFLKVPCRLGQINCQPETDNK
ncbi:MAG: hypothetical protein ACQEQG_05795 [Bacillota bacterium]